MTSKGQVTVPIEVRRRLGLRQGDRVTPGAGAYSRPLGARAASPGSSPTAG